MKANWKSGANDGRIRRLWAADTSLWTETDEAKWLGWLQVVEQELADVGRLQSFAADVKQRGFADVVLLGMGGSSLGPEVLSESFGHQDGWPRFHMLDSTDPAQIKTIEETINLRKTPVHCLIEIREHTRTQYFHGIFFGPRRRPAR